MDTRTRILAAALELYNEKGIDATTRHIASSIGISAGNLHYHFKHTDDIIVTLWNQLLSDFDQLVSALEQAEEINLVSLKSFYQQSFERVYKYRFVFLHFVAIATRIPVVRKDYKNLVKRREKEFKGVFHTLIQNGIFRNDIPDSVWTALVRQIFIIGDFWLSNNQLTEGLKDKKAAMAFANQIDALFYPYLSR